MPLLAPFLTRVGVSAGEIEGVFGAWGLAGDFRFGFGEGEWM